MGGKGEDRGGGCGEREEGGGKENCAEVEYYPV